MTEWTERSVGDIVALFPRSLPPGLSVAFSGRGLAPPEEPFPTPYLARRFAKALALDGISIVRASQVHGSSAVVVRQPPAAGEVQDAGPCDALATELSNVALVVQTADCVAIVLSGKRSIGVVHAGWRGSAANVAAAGVAALRELGEKPADLRAWLGPSIGACCYEVGSEVAEKFAREFVSDERSGSLRIHLRAVNRSQLVAAGVPSDRVLVHPACTKCGGPKHASYRRDGARAGRMIALVARLAPRAGLGVTRALDPRNAR